MHGKTDGMLTHFASRLPACWESRGNQRGSQDPQDRLLGWLTVNFHFDVVVKFVRRISVAVEPYIPASLAFCLDEPAFVSLDVRWVRSGSQARRIVVVVVVDRLDVLLELRVVGNLNDHVVVSAGL